MEVTVVIVEQLEANGMLRTLRMQSDYDSRLTIAFPGEYDEPRTGPFHFLDDRHERKFRRAFGECKQRRLPSSRFNREGNSFSLNTSWSGVPTEQGRLSYYALCLPENTVPIRVEFKDPRTNREYKKVVSRDDQRGRYVLYLECRSSYGTFDFALDVEFKEVPQTEFAQSEFQDATTQRHGAHVDAYTYLLPEREQEKVQNFFTKTIIMGDHNEVSGGQVGVVGRHGKAENNTFNQVWQAAATDVDFEALMPQLEALRKSMRQDAVDVEHDQAVAAIGEAHKAASNKEGVAVLKHLKAAGSWAFDTATKIGVTIAAKAIQSAIGLP